MKDLQLTVFEPGDMLGTISKDGKVAVFTVGPRRGTGARRTTGCSQSGLNMDDPIEALNLTVRTYNVLKREGINTIEEMAALYDERLDAIRRDSQPRGEERRRDRRARPTTTRRRHMTKYRGRGPASRSSWTTRRP